MNFTVSLPCLSPVIKVGTYFTDRQAHVYTCSITEISEKICNFQL